MYNYFCFSGIVLSPNTNVTPFISTLYHYEVFSLQDLSVAYEFLTHPTHLGCSYPLLFTPNSGGEKKAIFFQYCVLTSMSVLAGMNVPLQCSHLLWQQSLLTMVHRSPIWLEAWNCQAWPCLLKLMECFYNCCITEINASFCFQFISNFDKSRKICPWCCRIILTQLIFSPVQVTNNPQPALFGTSTFTWNIFPRERKRKTKMKKKSIPS